MYILKLKLKSFRHLHDTLFILIAGRYVLFVLHVVYICLKSLLIFKELQKYKN